MKNFNKGRSDKGPGRGAPRGNRFGGKPGFNRPSFGGRPGRSGHNGPRPELFDAICSRCGKPTLVPFRPNGKKPVFCRDCFSRENHENGIESPRSDRPEFVPPRKFPERPHERRDRPFGDRPQERPFDRERPSRGDSRPESRHDTRFAGTISKPPAPDPRIDDLKRQIDRLDSKIDMLLEMINVPTIETTKTEAKEKKSKTKK